ncbi:N-acetylmuramate alpha-1-phosphate uridylyltransferase MurU [Ferrimonas sp. YFM]|uniref:N-acetylmuramate alpha-1-phosphate uridylyltransferase MurU n=1 Tax=Ferrimonas sp. YFM TaxID=3028878 RepID=UPI0025738609|nr:nucleotidyltransferase family protein [Ferrimonas sp. YFM]BDY03310.1 mannose-1-phosphate guanylyltransferase [Ferrimonas sp. YFM]
MKAMILAAGRGERMRPLTDTTPKPLLPLQGRPMLEHHLERLARAGFRDVLINTAWLGEQFPQTLGDGRRFGLAIHYQHETQALETGGGIQRALSWLGPDPFLVVNGDVYCELEFNALPQLGQQDLAHLWLVANPAHNSQGDFALNQGRVQAQGEAKLTFSGIGLYRPELFARCAPGRFPLAPLLREAMAQGRVGGTALEGHWCDVGTEQRLIELEQRLNANLG